jgi:hypothetical protein
MPTDRVTIQALARESRGAGSRELPVLGILLFVHRYATDRAQAAHGLPHPLRRRHDPSAPAAAGPIRAGGERGAARSPRRAFADQREQLAGALDGKTASEVGQLKLADSGKDTKVLEAYAPVRFGARRPAGVFELD